jgi:hypothetical protein
MSPDSLETVGIIVHMEAKVINKFVDLIPSYSGNGKASAICFAWFVHHTYFKYQ